MNYSTTTYRLNLLITCLWFAFAWGCMSEEETQLNNAVTEAQTEYTLTQNVLALSEISADSALEHTLQHQSVHYANDQQSEIDLSNITAVAVDFDQIDIQQLNTTYAHILNHIRTSGGTLIVQNAEDSETMASLIGVGVSAELAYIEMPTLHQHGTKALKITATKKLGKRTVPIPAVDGHRRPGVEEIR